MPDPPHYTIQLCLYPPSGTYTLTTSDGRTRTCIRTYPAHYSADAAERALAIDALSHIVARLLAANLAPERYSTRILDAPAASSTLHTAQPDLTDPLALQQHRALRELASRLAYVETVCEDPQPSPQRDPLPLH